MDRLVEVKARLDELDALVALDPEQTKQREEYLREQAMLEADAADRVFEEEEVDREPGPDPEWVEWATSKLGDDEIYAEDWS